MVDDPPAKSSDWAGAPDRALPSQCQSRPHQALAARLRASATASQCAAYTPRQPQPNLLVGGGLIPLSVGLERDFDYDLNIRSY